MIRPIHGGTPPTIESADVLAEYRPILQQLLRICQDIRRALQEYPRDDVPKSLILSFLTKAIQTLRAIILLYKDDLCHEAQSLVRVVFELQVTFDAFIRLLQTDPRRACERLLDSMVLEKVKQQRASHFKGLDLVPGAPTPKELEGTETEIARRYSETELKKIRKHGFSGLSVEQRARQAGHADLYDIVYRNFSRNVHSADFTELLLMNEPALLDDRHADYQASRDLVGCQAAFISVAGIADTVNGIFSLGFDRRLRRVIARRGKLCASRREEA